MEELLKIMLEKVATLGNEKKYSKVKFQSKTLEVFTAKVAIDATVSTQN